MNFVQLKKDKLDVNAITELVTDESCGAISLFVGTTRDNFEDKKVLTLEYEAFEPMATKMMTKICEDLRLKWPEIYHIALFHRLGLVPVKEASVIIAISSPHRVAGLQSVQEAIELLKNSVPIWKKEIYDGEEAAWKENKESSPSTNPVYRPIKRPKLNFDACIIETPTVAKNLIQISADDLEVSRRIHCFVEKKRDEIDLQNISCFTEKPPELSEQEVDSCARVNSIVFKQKDLNGHLRVHRVKNEVGPQIKPDYTNTLNKLMANLPMSAKIKQPDINPAQFVSHGLEERLNSIEQFLGYNSTPAPRNIYERVKNIEDRLLFLESVSPEYYHFLGEKTPRYAPKKYNRKTYSIQELDQYIEEIKTSNL